MSEPKVCPKAAEGVLLGMGNPLLDISAHVDDGYLAKYSLEKNNAILASEEHLPIYEELVTQYKPDYIAGGATQNSIRVAQWMLETPKATTYIGCVGKDEYGKRLRKEASDEGVNIAYLEDPEAPTGTCACLINGKERTLVANIAAANNYKLEHLEQPEIWELVKKAEVIYISGFFLTVSVPSILKTAKEAAASNKTLVMNLAAPFICEFFKDQLAQTIPYWDVVVGNEAEAEAFAKVNGWETTDLKEIAEKLSGLPKENQKRKRIAIITHGSKPTIVATNGTVTEYDVDLIEEADIVDTNGAGDAFVGGFLSGLVNKKDVKDCIIAGQWAAHVIIQHDGCTFPETCSFEGHY